MNPNAVAFWLLGGGAGYLVEGNVHGGVFGLTVTVAISLCISWLGW